MNKALTRTTLSAAFALAALPATAWQFLPTTGGDLDDAANWGGTFYGPCAVAKMQSGPLTISSGNAVIPELPTAEGGTSTYKLLYRGYAFTNEWADAWAFQPVGIDIEATATVIQKSGILAPSAATTVSGRFEILADGIFRTANNATVSSGGALAVEGGALEIVSDYGALTINAGGSLSLSGGATLVFPANNKATLSIANGAEAVADGATLSINNDGNKIGGDGATLLFYGQPSSITSRFAMQGDEFVVCVSNATLSFASAGSSKLFITGTETSPADGTSDRTLRFCGANPHLTVLGSGGLYLRGSSTTFSFDLPAGAFTADPVIEIPNASASFRGDAGTCAASKVVVNVDNDCDPGTYTLLRGKNATTFLNGTSAKPRSTEKWVANCGSKRKATFQTSGTAGSADESLQVVVADATTATVISFR